MQTFAPIDLCLNYIFPPSRMGPRHITSSTGYMNECNGARQMILQYILGKESDQTVLLSAVAIRRFAAHIRTLVLGEFWWGFRSVRRRLLYRKTPMALIYSVIMVGRWCAWIRYTIDTVSQRGKWCWNNARQVHWSMVDIFGLHLIACKHQNAKAVSGRQFLVVPRSWRVELRWCVPELV